MAGTKDTKELLIFGTTLASGIGRALEDGKLSLRDMSELFSIITTANAAFQGIQNVPEELKDLSKSELQILVAQMKADLDLPNDELEKTIEKGFDFLLKLYDVWDVIRDYMK